MCGLSPEMGNRNVWRRDEHAFNKLVNSRGGFSVFVLSRRVLALVVARRSDCAGNRCDFTKLGIRATVLCLASSLERNWLRVLGILAIAEGSVMAIELVFRALNLIPGEEINVPEPHCDYCCPVKKRDLFRADSTF